MFLLKWYKEYLEIKNENAEKKRDLEYCESCETLKIQLAIATDERKRLIDRIIEVPEVKEQEAPATLKPVLPNRMNFNVRRQMLEQESRVAAQALKRNQEINKVATSPLTVATIKKELGVENG